MPSVTRCSLIEKRRRNTSPGMTSSPATFTFYSSPKACYLGSWHNITSVSQSKHQRSICLYLLHIASCLWNFFDSENVIDVVVKWTVRWKKGRRKGRGRKELFPPLVLIILSLKAKCQRILPKAKRALPDYPWHSHTVITVNAPTPVGAPFRPLQPLHMQFLLHEIFFLLLCLEKKNLSC